MGILRKIRIKVKALVDLVSSSIEEWFDKVIEQFNKWYSRYKYFVEKETYIDDVKQRESTYSANQQDQELANECQHYLDVVLPNGLTGVLEPMSDQERLDFVKNLVNELSNLMSVNISRVDYFSPTSLQEAGTMGVFLSDENTIYLNAMFLINLEEPKFTENMVRTILHELKHARQYAAIEDNTVFGYSQEILEVWRYNLAYYIRPEQCDEAYRKQPVEADAYGWANLIHINAETL